MGMRGVVKGGLVGGWQDENQEQPLQLQPKSMQPHSQANTWWVLESVCVCGEVMTVFRKL